MFKAGLVAIILLLCGCEPHLQAVNMPVSTKLIIRIPSRPKLASADLTPASKAMDVEKAHYQDIEILIDYSQQLTNLLQSASDRPQ